MKHYLCNLCGKDINHKRAEIGMTTCHSCGEKQARQRNHCIVPMHKSNYVVITNREDLIRINNKSG